MDEVLQDTLARLNASIFYREFSFSNNQFKPKFKPNPKHEEEFGDHVLWINDVLIVFQSKERLAKEPSEESDRNWFKKKVLGKATAQVRRTLSFLEICPQINIANQRGHIFNMSGLAVKHIIKVVVYDPKEGLPEDLLRIRHHVSGTAGFMHIMVWQDYVLVCLTLITAAELVEYFAFREKVIQEWNLEIATPPERALLGQFLKGDFGAQPTEEYSKYVDTLKHDELEFDIFGFLDGLGDNIVHEEFKGKDTDYYRILAEFAKLNREELRKVKERIEKCIEVVRAKQFIRPTQLISVNTGCGFVFMPVAEENFDLRQTVLTNITEAAKYGSRAKRQIGLSFAAIGDKLRVDACFDDRDWSYNADLEEKLKSINPFRPLRVESRPRYTFKS